jgi:hypothetical protein
MSNWTEEERAEALKRRLQGKGVMDEDAAAALGGGLRCAPHRWPRPPRHRPRGGVCQSQRSALRPELLDRGQRRSYQCGWPFAGGCMTLEEVWGVESGS